MLAVPHNPKQYECNGEKQATPEFRHRYPQRYRVLFPENITFLVVGLPFDWFDLL